MTYKIKIKRDIFLINTILRDILKIGPNETLKIINFSIYPFDMDFIIGNKNFKYFELDTDIKRRIYKEYKKRFKIKQFKKEIKKYIKKKITMNKKVLISLFVYLYFNKQQKQKYKQKNRKEAKKMEEYIFLFKDLKISKKDKQELKKKLQKDEIGKELVKLGLISIDIQKQGDRLLRIIKSNTPVRTGKLKRGWKGTKSGNKYLINNNIEYLTYVNNGTSRQRAQKFIEKSFIQYNTNALTDTFLSKHLQLKYKI